MHIIVTKTTKMHLYEAAEHPVTNNNDGITTSMKIEKSVNIPECKHSSKNQ